MRKSISPARTRELEVALVAAYVRVQFGDVTEAEASERAEVIVSINEVRINRGIRPMAGPGPLLMTAPALRQMLRAEAEACLPVAA